MDNPFKVFEMSKFVQDYSYFEFDEVSEDPKFVIFSTRKHGDFTKHVPGDHDLKNAKQLKAQLITCFMQISVGISTKDEWVILQVNQKTALLNKGQYALLF